MKRKVADKSHLAFGFSFTASLRVVKPTVDILLATLLIKCNDISVNPGPNDLNPGPSGSFYGTGDLPKLCGFKIAHLNVRSILNKMDHIRLLLSNKQFDIFTFSETWLNPAIRDSEVNIPGYTLTRNDRTSKRGGSTAIYVSDNIPYKNRTDLIVENIETFSIEVNRPKFKKLRLF